MEGTAAPLLYGNSLGGEMTFNFGSTILVSLVKFHVTDLL